MCIAGSFLLISFWCGFGGCGPLPPDFLCHCFIGELAFGADDDGDFTDLLSFDGHFDLVLHLEFIDDDGDGEGDGDGDGEGDGEEERDFREKSDKTH